MGEPLPAPISYSDADWLSIIAGDPNGYFDLQFFDGSAGTGTESQQQNRRREISGKNEEVRLCASTPIGR